MIATLLLSALIWPSPAPHSAPGATLPLTAPTAQDDAEVEAKIAAAGTNVARLQKLAKEYEEAKDRSAAKKVHLRVIELDADNEISRAALRHQFYDGRWFESFVELAKYKREEEARMKEKGLARWEDEWVPEGDVPFLALGWIRDEERGWQDPVKVAEAEQVEAWKAAGFQFRADDNSWIAPEDFEHWTNLEWKCGDEWLSLEEANEYHSEADTPWQLAGEHYITFTTCSWETGNLARWHADQTQAHLLRIFGIAPEEKPHFVLVPSLAAYNTVAGGGAQLLPDSEGFSSLHGAYFADISYDNEVDPPRFIGSGVSYWDREDPNLAPWGPFWVRWAAAQSYIDAIDRSWMTVGGWVLNKGRGDLAAYAAPFWQEKRIPRWLRYGAATYVERYLPNPEAAEGADPWGLRAFAFDDLRKRGGLRKLDELFAFGLTLQDIEGSTRMYQEAGLLVAFLLDGAPDDAGLQAVHGAFKQMLASGSDEDVAAAARALEAALIEREPAIRAFGRL